jgi:acyl dehydratase
VQIEARYVGMKLKEQRVTLSERLCMNYAACVGDANPCYFDDERQEGLLAHPMLATALTWQVAGKIEEYLPSSDFPLHLLFTQVHYSEHLLFHHPLRPDMHLTLSGQIAAILPHRAGTKVVMRFDAIEQGKKTIFTEYVGGLLRGVTCIGEGAGEENLPPMPSMPDSAEILWSQGMAIDPLATYLYDGCADIHFPIHTSPRFARQVGLPGIIVQGTLTLARAVQHIVDRQAGGDPRRLVELACRFAGITRPGSTLHLRLLAQQATATGIHLFFDVLKADGEPAIRGGYARLAAPIPEEHP